MALEKHATQICRRCTKNLWQCGQPLQGPILQVLRTCIYSHLTNLNTQDHNVFGVCDGKFNVFQNMLDLALRSTGIAWKARIIWNKIQSRAFKNYVNIPFPDSTISSCDTLVLSLLQGCGLGVSNIRIYKKHKMIFVFLSTHKLNLLITKESKAIHKYNVNWERYFETKAFEYFLYKYCSFHILTICADILRLSACIIPYYLQSRICIHLKVVSRSTKHNNSLSLCCLFFIFYAWFAEDCSISD